MYETIELYNDNGGSLINILKDCIYNYYVINNNVQISESQVCNIDSSNVIIKSTNKVEVLPNERREKCILEK